MNTLPEEIQEKCALDDGVSSQGGFWDLWRHLQQRSAEQRGAGCGARAGSSKKRAWKQRGEAETQSSDSALDWGWEVIHNPLEDWPSQGAIVRVLAGSVPVLSVEEFPKLFEVTGLGFNSCESLWCQGGEDPTAGSSWSSASP